MTNPCASRWLSEFFRRDRRSGADPSAHASAGAHLVTVTSEPLSLALLKPPGEFGVDIAVGEGQSLGVPMNLGGPAFGFFACQKKFVRNIPGRLGRRDC